MRPVTTVAASVDTKQTYVADFASSERELGGPEWLRAVRKKAIGHFEALGFPTQKHEQWKFTNLATLLRIPFKPAILGRPGGVVAENLEPFTFGVLKASQLVFVNGRYAPRLSYLRSLPEGVRVAPLAEMLRSEPEALEKHLTRYAQFEDDPFVALNTAFFQDGAYVEVPKGTVVGEPIHLLFVSTSRDLPIVAHPRNLILMGAGSQATVIESYAGWAPDVTFTNAVTEVAPGPAAVLDHYKIQREAETASHIATMTVHQDRDSSFSSHSMSFGGNLVRNYVHTLFRAPGGSLILNGL